MEKKRIGLIACEIFFREIAYYASRGPRVIDTVFLPKGLHDLGGDKVRETIQAEIDKMQERDYSRIILGYGLCNNGLVGLTGRRFSLVVPRAHDCITVFMGSRKRYQEYFFTNTGTYFHTIGWLERGAAQGRNFDSQLGPQQSLEDYIAKYGEENGRYLHQVLNAEKNYHKILYITLPLSELPDYRDLSRDAAKEKGWEWEEMVGDGTLLKQLIEGPYPEGDFLVTEPGQKIIATNDEKIIGSVPVKT
ncbi:MAG: DUF1638 domain-containing protein [Candidatus Ratteibacteria bacterium]|jgi:hypothetical protein